MSTTVTGGPGHRSTTGTSHDVGASTVDGLPRQRSAAPHGRAWAASGVVAGLAGLGGISASMASGAVYDESVMGDPEGIVALMSEQVPQLLVFHTLTLVGVVALVVFAAGLHRRLRDRLGEGSLLPSVAAGGLGLVTVAGLMGTALDTEFIFGLAEPDVMVAETAVLYGHWVGTVAWLWLGAGIAGVATAVAALRHAAAPRWIGWVSVVLGGLTLLFGVSPLQYMAGFTGPVWLTVVALGFLLGDRARRAAR
ncbi:hypothetical protein [Thalassiella azotivora]